MRAECHLSADSVNKLSHYEAISHYSAALWTFLIQTLSFFCLFLFLCVYREIKFVQSIRDYSASLEYFDRKINLALNFLVKEDVVALQFDYIEKMKKSHRLHTTHHEKQICLLTKKELISLTPKFKL